MPMEIKVIASDSSEHKQAAWSQIQQLSPDMADFIKEFTEVFGKPEELTVTPMGYANGSE